MFSFLDYCLVRRTELDALKRRCSFLEWENSNYTKKLDNTLKAYARDVPGAVAMTRTYLRNSEKGLAHGSIDSSRCPG